MKMVNIILRFRMLVVGVTALLQLGSAGETGESFPYASLLFFFFSLALSFVSSFRRRLSSRSLLVLSLSLCRVLLLL